MAIVKKWPLWEGRGVIRQFFREYDVSVVITSWLLYLIMVIQLLIFYIEK